VPDSHTFHNDIAWLADAGVTKGCNPPANTEFCPDDNVTRGQMGAFMRRLAESQVVDAGELDGKNPSFYSTVARSQQYDHFKNSSISLSDTGTFLAEVSVPAPESGFLFITGTSTAGNMADPSQWFATWLELDDGSCDVPAGTLEPANHISGSLSLQQPSDSEIGAEVSLASSALVPVGGGSRTVTLCGSSTDDSGTSFAGTVTAIWMKDGASSVASGAASGTSGSPSDN
jgi:hypothetical protein